jgi:NDP-sugar pyrophosphorylase family protein
MQSILERVISYVKKQKHKKISMNICNVCASRVHGFILDRESIWIRVILRKNKSIQGLSPTYFPAKPGDYFP